MSFCSKNLSFESLANHIRSFFRSRNVFEASTAARIAVEEKGPDRLIRHDKDDESKKNGCKKKPQKPLESLGFSEEFQAKQWRWDCQSFGDRNRFKIRQLREVRKGEKMAEENNHLDKQSRVDPMYMLLTMCRYFWDSACNIHRTTVFGTEWRAIQRET